jgi:hypothetical protein
MNWTNDPAPPRGGGAGALFLAGASGSSGQRENAQHGPPPAVLLSSRHLSRKDARIDAEIDERVNDGSADERGDDYYQHFQTEGTHTGSPPFKEGVIGQRRRFQENTPAALRGHRAALVVISGRAAMVPATAGRIQRTSSAPCVPVLSKPNP